MVSSQLDAMVANGLQMVTNNVFQKSNKLVHGRYKEHYQFVHFDGSIEL